jgi:hypothetical protein
MTKSSQIAASVELAEVSLSRQRDSPFCMRRDPGNEDTALASTHHRHGSMSVAMEKWLWLTFSEVGTNVTGVARGALVVAFANMADVRP